MIKQCFRFVVAAALVVVSGSFAKADTYSIVSSWADGSAYKFTGVGTFNWNGSTFSDISFTFTETKQGTCGVYGIVCVITPAVLWTATPTDGELTPSDSVAHPTLVIGANPGGDCSTPAGECVEIELSSKLVLGGTSTPTLTGLVAGSSVQGVSPQPSLVSASVTDLPEPSAIAALATVSGVLGFVIFRRRKLVR
jgi:hypothetical protein